MFKKILTALSLCSTPSYGAPPVENFFELKTMSIDGKEFDLNQFKGKAVLAVNTASKCGYTKQYKGLEALYEKYKDKGFVVVGFPSNDFWGQEPGTEAEIKKFCELNFGVKFPMTKKLKVKGDDKDPIYQFLTLAGEEKGEVSWNFEKFLISPAGKVVGRYKSGVKPESDEIVKAIEAHLPR